MTLFPYFLMTFKHERVENEPNHSLMVTLDLFIVQQVVFHKSKSFTIFCMVINVNLEEDALFIGNLLLKITLGKNLNI